MVIGCFKNDFAKLIIGLGKVAENITDCLSFGSLARIARISSINPISSILSASSKITISTSDRFKDLFLTCSNTLAVVPIAIFAPERMAETCEPSFIPP